MSRTGTSLGGENDARPERSAWAKRDYSLWLAAAMFSAFALVALAVRGNALPGFDLFIMSRLPHWHRNALEPVMRVLTDLGSLEILLLLALPVALWLGLKHPRQLPFLLLTFVASPLSTFFKRAVDRQRPEKWLLGFEPYLDNQLSFPSGHAAASVAFYGFLILLIWRYVRAPLLRWVVAALVGLVALTVVLSRVYLGVHYPTDVLGSIFLSLGWLAFINWLRRAGDVDGNKEAGPAGPASEVNDLAL